MKTIELDPEEILTIVLSLRGRNLEQKRWIRDPLFRPDFKARAKIARKLIKIFNVRGEIYP
jgi:hypothetical protein